MPDNDKNIIRQTNASLRYYFNIDPDKLTDDEWAMRSTELEWVLKVINPQTDKK